MTTKASTLRELSLSELETTISDLKSDYLRLRQQNNSQSIRPHELKNARREIARAMTVRTEKIYEEMYEKHKSDKKQPKCLLVKKSKAIRNELSKKQRNKKVHSVVKKLRMYPRKYYSYSE